MFKRLMKLIDVHAHLEHKRFKKDLDSVVKRFKKAGGKFIITSGVNKSTNREILKISEKYDSVMLSFGIYPVDALALEMQKGEVSSKPEQGSGNIAGFVRDLEGFDVDAELKWIEENKDKCVAIGECGLDYNWEEFQSGEARKMQKEVFRKVLKLAKEIDKPVIIHSRKAELDATEILEEEKMKKVVMHCFNGKKSLIKRGVENGWYFSVPPVIKRLEHFKMLVELVPLKQLFTETDAPYLSPVAGERNEPANVAVAIEEIAKIKGMNEKEVGEQIFENAEKLFNI